MLKDCKMIKMSIAPCAANVEDYPISYRQLGSKFNLTVTGLLVVLYPLGLDTGTFTCITSFSISLWVKKRISLLNSSYEIEEKKNDSHGRLT